MKALLPGYCRPMGYAILALALFMPFLMFMLGKVTDNNLLFYKECSKLLMMVGALMILLAITKNESIETESIRIKAMRNAFFITLLFIFGGMLYRVAMGDIKSVDTSSFLTFMIFNVICLEYGINKARIEHIFKK